MISYLEFKLSQVPKSGVWGTKSWYNFIRSEIRRAGNIQFRLNILDRKAFGCEIPERLCGQRDPYWYAVR
jgi:hypothetical protein